jgi:hypothetical protein
MRITTDAIFTMNIPSISILVYLAKNTPFDFEAVKNVLWQNPGELMIQQKGSETIGSTNKVNF